MRSRGTPRLPVPGKQPAGEFSARSSPGRVRGENASRGQARTPETSGSFDSVNGLASESIHFAQDDRVGETQRESRDKDVPHFSPNELSSKCFLSLVPQPIHARADFTSVREKSLPLNKSDSPSDFASA
jgi:hypothetical protein